MGVSFKVARAGSRYRHRLPSPETAAASGERASSHEDAGDASVPKRSDRKVVLSGLGDGSADYSIASANCGSKHAGIEHKASFSLKLFPDGFSIGKPTEGLLLPLLEDVPKLLHPYDKAAKTLFSAIECGCLPGDILDDIPCNYLNGSLICEVWDYRNCMFKLGNNDSLGDDFPKVHKVRLRMGMENVVKDVPSISNDSWTYNDLLKAEAQIIKVLQPVLSLGPKPSLDRLCETPVSEQLDLGIYARRLIRKKHHISETNFSSTYLTPGRDISSNGFVKNLKPQPCLGLGNVAVRCAQYATKQRNNIERDIVEHALPVALQPKYTSAVTCSISVPCTAPDQNVRNSCTGLNSSNLTGKRNMYIMEPDPKATFKKPKQEPLELDSCQFFTSERDNLLERESQSKIIQLQKQLEAQKMQHLRLGDQNYPRLETIGVVIESSPKLDVQMPSQLYQERIQHNAREKSAERKVLSKPKFEKEKEDHELDIRSQQHPLSLVKCQPSQMQWTNTVLSIDKYPKKENASRKRKLSQGPQVLSGAAANSPVSKLGENHRMSLGAPCSKRRTVAAVELQNDKVASIVAASVGTTSMNPSSSNSLLLENQISVHTKMNHKAVNKVASRNMSETEAPATVNGTKVPVSLKRSSAGIPSVQPPSGTNSDPSIFERFFKIEQVTKRYGLDNKKNKVDMYLTGKPLSNCPVPLVHLLIPEDNDECQPLTDDICMSKYLIRGSRNGYKTRILTFLHVKYYFTGKSRPLLVYESWIKLILFEFEGLDEHKVGAEVTYGDEQRIHVALLPSPHHADLFAAQFTSLMERDGYELVDDQLQPTQARSTDHSNSNSLHIGSQGVVSSQSLKIVTPIRNGTSTPNPHRFPPQNIPSPTRMTPSFFSLTRPQQLEIGTHLSSMQQQHSEDQRFSSLAWKNPSGIINTEMGNQMPSSLIHLQNLHMQQSQRQQNQQQTILPTNMANLGAARNVLGVGGHISSLNMSQINDNFRQVSGSSRLQSLNSGDSDILEVQLGKLRQAKKPGIGVMDNTTVKSLTDGAVGITGNGPLLDQALGRSFITEFPFIERVPMGLPNSPSTDFSICNYDQKQQKIHQWQLQLQHQLGLPQLQGSPLTTRMSQTLPMSPNQLSLGSSSRQVHAGASDICSPQMSLQTVGSGGSITSSPMELRRIWKR